MDLIYMNAEREDIGVLHNYEFDLAFGNDENSFECVIDRNSHCCGFGFYLYIEGTEYGGIIDSVESKNSTQEVVYSGRTWHGVLNSKVLEPASGEDYLVCSGEANAVIRGLISKMGLADLFLVSDADSGLTIKNYKMNRYINGYDGIMKMLKTVDGKLRLCNQSNGQVLLSAVPIVDYTQDGLDSDLLDLDVKRTSNTVNHLICLGSGNLSERMVVHLYVDENGNISRNQTISGVDEYVAVYEYSNAEDEADLVSNGTDRLKELMQQDDLSVDVNDVGDPYDVGDLVGATDNIANISVTVPITRKIVTIKNGVVTIDIKTDTISGSTQSNGSSSGGGSSGGGGGQSGQDGKDGISCTHEWNGTVLTITSASGTSSADLKGEKGDDATINGVNALTIEAGENITLEQTGNVLKIGSTGGGGAAVAMTIEEIWAICGYDPNALPDGYTMLSYIEGDGTQYIDTGFTPNQDTRVVLSGYNLSADSSWIYGVWHANGDTQFAANVKNDYSIRYGTGSAQLGNVPVGAFDIDQDKNAYNFNGTAGTLAAQTFACSYTMFLFAINAAGSVSGGRFTGRIYACKIYDNGTLVRDFAPCINPSGEYGMFDRVEDKFYGSEGTLITESNISNFFTVSNDSYYFKGSGSVFTTTNSGVSSETAQTTLKAKQDMDISFDYSYASEANFDKFTLTFAGTTVENGVSGAATTKSYSGRLTAGQTIVFKYSKDSSGNSNGDKCTFSNMVIPTTFTGA